MNAVRRYLRLFGRYPACLGVRWSETDNVLEVYPPRPMVYWQGPQETVDYSYEDCNPNAWITLAFAPDIADFLEGFAGWRPLIHFSFTAHLILLLRRLPPDGHASPNRVRLWKLAGEFGVGASLRHAGAFCAQLCQDVPEAIEANEVAEICQRLRRKDTFLHDFMVDPEETIPRKEYPPPWSPEEFEACVLEALDNFSDEEVESWLKHGRGPVGEAAKALTRELPATLSGRLARLLERPRMAGAQAFVKHLAGALALPPRRLTYEDLPVGGYTNVTTHGKVEQLLPSQFALDEWDFFRRYAEHELLYFRREDPNDPTRHELVILLDQGVRTWGDVRLVLGAAFLALAKNTIRTKTPIFVATTGSAGIVDPLDVTEEQLGQVVEASDLSPHPALALEALLERPADCARDIVLLTHPRNLNEEEVRSAARRVQPGTRLFALTLDGHGQAALNEMRRGTAVPVRQFHVDLSPAPEPAPTPPAPAAGKWTTWSGDVEPIGFPFLFGIDGRVPAECFDFDGSTEQYLLTACRHGLLHLWRLSGGLQEILPRAFHKEKVVTDVRGVVGVADGFVVVARLEELWLAVHYRLAQRRCIVHHLGTSKELVSWAYVPGHHCFLGLETEHTGCCVDLSTGERYLTCVGGRPSRARAAWDDWEQNRVPRRRLDITIGKRPYVTLNNRTGKLHVSETEPFWNPFIWNPFIPLADGKPLLEDCVLEDPGQLGGGYVAVQAKSLTSGGRRLHVFRWDGVPVYEGVPAQAKPTFRLSANGKMLARQTGQSVIVYGPVNQLQLSSQRTEAGGFSQQVQCVVDDRELLIVPGTRQLMHRLKWSDGRLSHVIDTMRKRLPSLAPVAIPTASLPVGCRYDGGRWLDYAFADLVVASDRYGHLAVFSHSGRLVCMFMAFRSRLAGWLPDGTYFGPALMTGRPSHVDAWAKFGKALRNTE